MKKHSLIFVMFLATISLFAQDRQEFQGVKRNTIYLEAFGQGLYNSISVDRLYNLDRNVRTSLSGGLTIIPHPALGVLGIPVSYNYIFGRSAHHLELGIGFTAMYIRLGHIGAGEVYTDQNGVTQVRYFTGHRSHLYTYITPKIGYRFQKDQGGLFLRVTLTPPVAGINYIGETKGGTSGSGWGSYIEYFSSAAFFGYRIFPWAGISLGWTLKK